MPLLRNLRHAVIAPRELLAALGLLFAVALLASACSAREAEPAAPGDPSPEQDIADETARDVGAAGVTSSPRAETPDRGAVAPAPEYPAPVEAARERHAVTLGVAVAEVTVLAYEETSWSDSSLGCGRPGEMYMQVITPGYRVVVSHDGEQAIYHTDQRETPSVMRCDRPGIRDLGDAPAPGSPTE